MIATASLTIPSPKSKLKRVGCSSYFTMEMAAMTSVEQRRDDMRRISAVLKFNFSHSLTNKISDQILTHRTITYPVVALYICIQS